MSDGKESTAAPPAGSAWSALNPVNITSWVLEALLVKESSTKASGSSRPLVAVTGAGGYIATHVIKVLLENGYRVRGTVRDPDNKEKYGHLKDIFPGLELFKADLLEEGSFDACFEGCMFVMHMASPFIPQVPDPQKQLVEPALNGTLNVLRSVERCPTIKRVVLTSSMAAIASEAPPADHSKKWTEDDWNRDSTLEKGPYRLSKRLAEEAAWDFMNNNLKPKRNIDLVVMNPSFVLGPAMSTRTDSTSVGMVKKILTGGFNEDGTPGMCFGAVDVRDVARAHVIGLELPEAAGNRFILSSEKGVSPMEMAQKLKGKYGSWPLPKKEKEPVTYRPLMDNSKAQKLLQLQFTPIEKTLNDMAAFLIKSKMIEKPE